MPLGYFLTTYILSVIYIEEQCHVILILWRLQKFRFIKLLWHIKSSELESFLRRGVDVNERTVATHSHSLIVRIGHNMSIFLIGHVLA